MAEFAYLPAPAPYEGPERCPRCVGARVTGQRYQFTPGGARPLLVDELCPECDGCGRARHVGCDPAEHAEWQHEDDYDDDGCELVVDELCFSCHGRRWWVCQGFDKKTVRHLRVPCGCAEPLMTTITREDADA